MENAVDALEAHFRKAHSTLSFVQHKLELEFSETYDDYVNPMQMLSRMKKLQEELPTVEKQCAKLLAAKQDVADTLRESLVSNRTLLRGLQARAGLASKTDAADAILKEWEGHSARLTTRQ